MMLLYGISAIMSSKCQRTVKVFIKYLYYMYICVF